MVRLDELLIYATLITKKVAGSEIRVLIRLFANSVMFSGAFLEDASVVSCGHSFGGLMLRRVLEMVGVGILRFLLIC